MSKCILSVVGELMAVVIPLVQNSNHRARVVCCVEASIENVSTTASIIGSKTLVTCLSFPESQAVCNLRQRRL